MLLPTGVEFSIVRASAEVPSRGSTNNYARAIEHAHDGYLDVSRMYRLVQTAPELVQRESADLAALARCTKLTVSSEYESSCDISSQPRQLVRLRTLLAGSVSVPSVRDPLAR